MKKKCTKCKLERDLKHFNLRPLKTKVGYRSQCKYCESTTSLESYYRKKVKNVELEKLKIRLSEIEEDVSDYTKGVLEGKRYILEHEEVELYIELIEMVNYLLKK